MERSISGQSLGILNVSALILEGIKDLPKVRLKGLENLEVQDDILNS